MSAVDGTRVFWLYSILTLFFCIIGLLFLIQQEVAVILIAIWLLANILLTVLAYCCIVSGSNIILVTVLFIGLLIAAVVWASNITANPSMILAATYTIVGGLIYCLLSVEQYILLPVLYITLWLYLTFYNIVQQQ